MDDLLELDVAIPEMADLLSEVCCYFVIVPSNRIDGWYSIHCYFVN